MSKFEVKTGAVSVEVQSIVNIDEIRKALGEKAANVDECNRDNKKELVAAIAYYKKMRTPLKKEKAAARKQCDTIKANISEEFDEAINIVSEHIEPYEEKVKIYDEEIRKNKVAKLRDELEPKIQELNAVIFISNYKLENELNESLEFSEEWAKNLKGGLEYIKTYNETAINKYNQAKNNITAIEILCDTLKNKYNLTSDINYKLILGNDRFTGQLTELQKRLDDFAADQQAKELEAEQRKEEEIKREQEKTKEPDPLPENYRITMPEVSKQEKPTITESKTYSRTLYFPELTKEQGGAMIDYFIENKIEFKVVE